VSSVSNDLWFSDAAYRGPGGNYDDAPAGWQMIAQSDPNSDGYFGVAFKNTQTGEVVVANRGSRLDKEGLKQDWAGSDTKILGQGGLGIPASFNRSTEFANQVTADNPGAPIHFTGHSLGGAEAQVQAAVTGGSATTFGAPGAAFAVDSNQAAAASGSVVNYVLPGDLIGSHGKHIGETRMITPSGTTVVKDIAAIVVASLIGGLLGALAVVLGLVIANHPLGNYAKALAGMSGGGGGGNSSSASGGGPPAARITDLHTCPMVTGVVPHVGGPIITGMPTVLTGNQPQARVTDIAICTGPPDMIIKASSTVLVGGLPAARIGDTTVHGGVIVTGLPTVLIGG